MIINPFGGGPINLQDKLATVSASQQLLIKGMMDCQKSLLMVQAYKPKL